MDLFWKGIGAALIAAILSLALEKQGKDFSLLLTVAVSGMLAASAVRLLEPVMKYLDNLMMLGDSNTEVLIFLIKILGIGLTGEISSAVCTDSGNSALGKGIRFLANSAIFLLSIPVFSALVELIQQLLRSI